MLDFEGDVVSKERLAEPDFFNKVLDGEVKFKTVLIDFGESSYLQEKIETESSGCMYFRSPESIDDLFIKKNSDNWSVGMLIIACLFKSAIGDLYYKDYSKSRSKVKPTLEVWKQK